MAPTVTHERFVLDFSAELDAHNAALFAGAGLSVAQGFVDWRGLLKPLADDLGLDVDRESDLISLAQYHVNKHGGNKTDLNDLILNKFTTKGARKTENHTILAKFPLQVIWTTNYDALLEESLRAVGKIVDVKHEVKQLPLSLKNKDVTVYKMHGDAAHPHDAVIAKSEYETYHLTHELFLTALAGDLVSRTFLFVGFSFSDPNLHYVLSRLRTNLAGQMRKHYCILKKERREGTEPIVEATYRLVKQDHFITDLARYGIRTVLVDEYAEITSLLQLIEVRLKRSTVFVSGSAAIYAPMKDDDARALIGDLGQSLIAEGGRVVSGLGVGVGSPLLEGVLRQIYEVEQSTLHDQLVLRPFPQGPGKSALRRRYRIDMLDYAGMAFFLFGNRRLKSAITLSTGMKSEFDLAVEANLMVIPLGFTGYMAEQLWNTVAADTDKYYPGASADFLELFRRLGEKSTSWRVQLKNVIKLYKHVAFDQ